MKSEIFYFDQYKLIAFLKTFHFGGRNECGNIFKSLSSPKVFLFFFNSLPGTGKVFCLVFYNFIFFVDGHLPFIALL